MSLQREQIERFEVKWSKQSDTPWQNWSKSRKWLKNQMNRFMRRLNKKIDDDDRGGKLGRKPTSGWEW